MPIVAVNWLFLAKREKKKYLLCFYVNVFVGDIIAAVKSLRVSKANMYVAILMPWRKMWV